MSQFYPPYGYGAPASTSGQAPHQGPQKSGGGRTAVKIIFAVVLGLIVLMLAAVGILMGLAYAFGNGSASAGGAFKGPDSAYIAKISVVGQIGPTGDPYSASDTSYHHAWTVQTIDTLIADKNNKAVYLYLDTPGGTVYESDALYLKLKEYKEKTGRPVYAYMGSMAASGGYYAAASADKIYANRNTWTGSIGVTMGTLIDVSGFLSEHGIKTETITAGRNKAMGSLFDPITDEQRAIFRGLIGQAYDQFTGVVAESRKLSIDKVKELADGRVYTAQQAKDNGLIDEIMGQKEAEDAMIKDVGGDVTIVDCRFIPDTSIAGLLGVKIDELKQGLLQTDVAAVLRLAESRDSAPQPMCLYEG